MAAYIDVTIYTILEPERAAFNVENFITDASYDVQKSRTPVATINRQKEARGHTKATQTVELTFKAMVPKGQPHPFNRLYVSGDEFKIHAAHMGGERVTFGGCELEQLGVTTNAENVEFSITVKATTVEFSDSPAT